MRRGFAWNPADVAAALIALLALALRLREPLSSPIIGAEDPYLRMTDTWDLIQGDGISEHYPPGFAILTAPFALFGADAFYVFARFGPPFLGAVEALGVYLLARGRLQPVAALAAPLFVALMPENIFRTNLLFPTALDLALLPFAFLLILRGSEGSRRAWWLLLALAFVMLVTHPWVVALLVPTMLLLALGLLARHRGKRAAQIAAASGVAGVALLIALTSLPGTWNPTSAFFENAWPRFVELVQDPSSVHPLPIHVHLPGMLTMPALVLAGIGALVAVLRRERLDLLALVWSAFLLPFVLVDWFDIWFIPHRTVAYLSIGIALLAALPFDAAARVLRGRVPRVGDTAATAGGLGVVLLLMLPNAVAVEPWYRLYDEDDYEAWDEVRARDPQRVITASWQAAAGYRGITGGAAAYNPTFFENGDVREAMLDESPGTIVLIDKYARENDHPRGFLDGWRKIGEWGDGQVKAYTPYD